MPGRPRKPLLLHKLQGTDRADRMRPREGELALTGGSIGDPPEWMEGDALEEWKRLTEHPEYSQVLSSAHRSVLIEYCTIHGWMVADARGERDDKGKRPITASERNTLSSLRMQLGVTPASQSKVKGPSAPSPKNKWANLG